VNVGVTIGLTVIVTAFEVAGEPAKQGVALDVISQVITSPVANEPEINVTLVCPDTIAPFFFQTYAGELPPLVGVAVNVIELPEQMPVADAAMDTLAVRTGFTFMPMLFEVVGEPVKHGVAFDVITQVTASLFDKEVDVNVEASVPASVPFTFHWYEGDVPPFVGVAVNVTEVPEQIVVAVAAIETLAGTFGLTLIVPVAFTDPHPPVSGIE
jgi:hypothetical protein